MKTHIRSRIALLVAAILVLALTTGCYFTFPAQPTAAPQAPIPQGANPQGPVPQGSAPQDQGLQAPVPQGSAPQGLAPQGPVGPQGPVPGNPSSPIPNQGNPIPNQGNPIPNPIPNQIPGAGPQQGQQADPGQQPVPQPPTPVPSGSQQGCAGAPVIPFFTANPTSIKAGDSVTLSWGNVTNGTTGPWVQSTTIQLGLGEVGSAASSRVVKPTSTTTYTLTGTGCAGTSTKQVTVTVNSANAAIPTVMMLQTDLQATDMYKDEGNLLHIGIKNNSSYSGNIGFGVSCTGTFQTALSTPKSSLTYSASSLTYPFNANQERWTNTNIKLDKGTGFYNLTCTISAPSDTNTANNSVSKTLTIAP